MGETKLGVKLGDYGGGILREGKKKVRNEREMGGNV